MRPAEGSSERGQVLVIVAGALVVIIALVGLVIDGGYAWGQQRQTQNASDAAAEAGAVQLAANFAGVSPSRTDGDVQSAVDSAATANGISAPPACYTSFSGHPITATGVPSQSSSSCVGAAMVGAGTIPPGAYGVRAEGSKTFPTFLMRILGFPQLTTTAPATARAGWSASACSAEAGCIVLPIAVPITQVTCSGTGALQTSDAYAQSTLYIIPLCKNGPGNVGWLDWTAGGGGSNELENSIANPDNPALKWPGWYYIADTGNTNKTGVETALQQYDGQVVQFPQFDATCDAQPTGSGIAGCPAGHLGGTGQNQWYHLSAMLTFRFCSSADAGCVSKQAYHGAYVNGNNSVPCDTGNGATGCLAGYFIISDGSGEVTAAPPPNCDPSVAGFDPTKCLSSINVQLIH